MPVDHSSDIPADNQRLTTRSIRSFVIRNGRMTPAQTDAIDRLLPRFGISYCESPIDIRQQFCREAPIWLEIGFGNGDVLHNVASGHPDIDLLGVEVHAAGVGHALLGIEQQELSNIRIIQHDAIEVLDNMLPDSSIDKVLLLFPDPWHKKRHHKRRILQKDFLNGVARILKKDGILHCATDWAEYGEWMIERLEDDARFQNIVGPGLPADRPEWRPLTRFEKRGHRLGHTVVDLTYRKV